MKNKTIIHYISVLEVLLLQTVSSCRNIWLDENRTASDVYIIPTYFKTLNL